MQRKHITTEARYESGRSKRLGSPLNERRRDDGAMTFTTVKRDMQIDLASYDKLHVAMSRRFLHFPIFFLHWKVWNICQITSLFFFLFFPSPSNLPSGLEKSRNEIARIC